MNSTNLNNEEQLGTRACIQEHLSSSNQSGNRTDFPRHRHLVQQQHRVRRRPRSPVIIMNRFLRSRDVADLLTTEREGDALFSPIISRSVLKNAHTAQLASSKLATLITIIRSSQVRCKRRASSDSLSLCMQATIAVGSDAYKHQVRTIPQQKCKHFLSN